MVDPESRGLELTADEMRALGHAAVDALVDDLVRLGERPASRPPADDLLDRFAGPAPAEGCDPVALVRRVMDEIVPVGIRPHHPGMLAYVGSSPTFPGAVADLLAAGATVFAGTWQAGPGAAAVELTVLRWLREELGLAAETEGVVLSGGSTANLVGLAVARDCHPAGTGGVAYVSTEAHASVVRALRVLGVADVRVLPADGDFRLSPEAVGAAAGEDRAAGRSPWCVVASAGTTNTGAVDDLPALADACAEAGTWLHVDASYGGFAALTEEGARCVRGLERADSLVLDPHKWLFAPIGAGVALVREPGLLERTFAMRPEYLQDAHRLGGVDFADRGPELTRPFRALKVWMTIEAFGMRRIRAAIAGGLELAALAAGLVDASPAVERVTGPCLSVLTFRSTRGVDPEAIVDAVARSGRGVISSTVVRGEPVARLCVLAHRTDEAALRGVLEVAFAAS